MNKLQLISILFISAILLNSCESKSNKSVKQDKTSTEKLPVTEEKVFDVDYLVQCALDGKIEPLQAALENGFKPNSIDANKRTPLMMAAFNGHTEVVQLLIKNGANVNLTDQINRTALMYASTGPFTPTVVALLEAGAQPNMIDNEEKWTAVMMAASEGQLDVIKTLIAYGADLNMVDIDGESSLDFAKSKGHTEVATFIKSQLK